MRDPDNRIGITILGATGSIGCNTLDVLTRHRQQYEIIALTANDNVQRMTEICRTHRPKVAVMVNVVAAKKLATNLADTDIEVISGAESLQHVACREDVDYVMAAIVGAAGLLSTLAAARAGKRILLANKEALVMSGDILMRTIQENGAELLPIDSEHNAIFQSLPDNFRDGLSQAGVKRIYLTASGGALRTMPIEQLDSVTPEQATAHPNWDMGRKISVDSATMMNKGLEVIEAHWLFGASACDIQVVIHPESIVHSMVAYSDGSVLAQLGNPDMRTPITHSLAWPDRYESGVEPLNILETARLNFEAPDMRRFPCLELAYEALRQGGTSPATLNAANEVAVEAFLDNRLKFTRIPGLIEQVLETAEHYPADTLETILAADRQARAAAETLLSTGVA